jgi:phage baseplate assembly protein W
MPLPVKNRTYQGYSTILGDGLSTLFDQTLVDQDLANCFNTKKGEVLTDPTYGSIIWSMIFEPASPANLNIINNDTVQIFNNEPRVQLLTYNVTPSSDPNNPGYTLTAQLQYVGLNIAGTFTANFFGNLVDTGL